MKRSDEKGQALIFVVLGMGIFMFGALGLAIDGAQMFAHRQMAQAAADAAAQAGIMSIFDGTAGTGASAFATSGTITCTTTDAKTPCVYARNNGFGATANDTVTIDYPGSAAVPGVSLSGADPVNVIRATVQRTINTGLIRFLGPSTATVKAIAIAAIVNIVAPIPIIVTHPTLPNALDSNGGPTITICGGPSRSIQVNSSSATAAALNNNATIDLSKAGPLDSLLSPCTTGTGADFGVNGGPAAVGFTFVPGIGKYIQPSSPIADPLASVAAPAAPGTVGTKAALANGVSGCPAAPQKPCQLYSPGLWTGGINVQNETAVFQPGLYYINGGGFSNAANGFMTMATGFPNDAATGAGMVVYNTGAGTFSIAAANSTANLVGSDPTSTYEGILFFQNRGTLVQQDHSFGGGGSITLKGTIYIVDTAPTNTVYQRIILKGNSGSTTTISGEIITSALRFGGNSGITMQLDATARLVIRQVALVK